MIAQNISMTINAKFNGTMDAGTREHYLIVSGSAAVHGFFNNAIELSIGILALTLAPPPRCIF